VATILPELGLAPGITIRHLLSHTSGIADLLAPLRPELLDDGERRWTPGEVVARVGDPWFAPGTGYGYSNTNYVLLGMVVERVTGRTFAEELSRRLLDPLDLDSTGMLLQPDAPFLMRPSWASAFGTSGAMYASASDLVRWIDALYGGNVLLPGTRAQALAFGEQGYGMGTELIEVGTHTGYGHSGLLQGFTALAVHLPDENVTLVVVGTFRTFDPAKLLTFAVDGEPSILDLALAARSG
jgi:D-alanyl-D-alanine carboxypeptidase